jgi:RNA polymerase sigma factor (sigma-70 family)
MSAKETTGEVCDCVPIVASVVKRLKAKGLSWWADAEDLKSIGLLAVLEARPTDGALIRQVAHAAMVDAIRKEAVRQRGRVDVESEQDDGENYAADGWDARLVDRKHYRLEDVDRLAPVWEAMKALPPRWYRVMILRFWEGLTNEEVAQECGTSVKAVNHVVTRALAELRAALSAERAFPGAQTITLVEGPGSSLTANRQTPQEKPKMLPNDGLPWSLNPSPDYRIGQPERGRAIATLARVAPWL